jgi:very-short-patch-repair endonuclease
VTSKKPIGSFKRTTARRLRANATNAEKALWQHLRRFDTGGTHFRRQVPVGPYIADFACMAARLLIEIDGSQHGVDTNILNDKKRTQWLEAEGYRIIRFWNNDIVENLDGVLDTIYVALHGSRDVDPSHLKHRRWKRSHPTPARTAPRPSPSRGG